MSAWWPTVVRVRRPHGLPDLVLRGLRPRDRREWEELRARNGEWLRPWEARSPHESEPVRFAQMVRSLDREAHAGRLQPFAIECDGRLVGQMHLSAIHWGATLTGQAGYWVDEAFAGRGIAPTALAALVDHAFLGLGLHRVAVDVRPDNHASRRVVEKLGFRDEGLRRRAIHLDDGWCDHRAYALTVEDLDGDSLVGRWHAGQTPTADGEITPV